MNEPLLLEDLDKSLRDINHDLDHVDEIMNSIDEQQELGCLEDRLKDVQ